MKNILLLIISCFLFSTLSYADYEMTQEDYDQSAPEQQEAPQEDYSQEPVETEQPQDDRVEEVSLNAEEDTAYNNF